MFIIQYRRRGENDWFVYADTLETVSALAERLFLLWNDPEVMGIRIFVLGHTQERK